MDSGYQRVFRLLQFLNLVLSPLFIFFYTLSKTDKLTLFFILTRYITTVSVVPICLIHLFSLTLPSSYFSPYGSTSNLSVFYFSALAWVVSYINILHVLSSRRHKMLNLVQIWLEILYRTPCGLQVSKVFFYAISHSEKSRTNDEEANATTTTTTTTIHKRD